MDQKAEDYYLGSPALAVAVVSENDTAEEIAGKVEIFVLNGAAEVWALYPNQRQIWRHYREGKVEGKAERLSGAITSPLLPGFLIDLDEVLES